MMNKMEFINHTPITNLNSSTMKWTIRARAQAVWKGITRETKEFRGLNILFVDDSVSALTTSPCLQQIFVRLNFCGSINCYVQSIFSVRVFMDLLHQSWHHYLKRKSWKEISINSLTSQFKTILDWNLTAVFVLKNTFTSLTIQKWKDAHQLH